MNDIIHLQLNNWFSGRDYPAEEPFIYWITSGKFCDDKWCKENQLCVNAAYIDTSINWCIAAPREWIETHCPIILSDDSFNYQTQQASWNEELNKLEWKTIQCIKWYSDFIISDDEGRCGTHFPEYKEKNYGVHWEVEDEDGHYYVEGD